jgi:hypothetical protein
MRNGDAARRTSGLLRKLPFSKRSISLSPRTSMCAHPCVCTCDSTPTFVCFHLITQERNESRSAMEAGIASFEAYYRAQGLCASKHDSGDEVLPFREPSSLPPFCHPLPFFATHLAPHVHAHPRTRIPSVKRRNVQELAEVIKALLRPLPVSFRVCQDARRTNQTRRALDKVPPPPRPFRFHPAPAPNLHPSLGPLLAPSLSACLAFAAPVLPALYSGYMRAHEALESVRRRASE